MKSFLIILAALVMQACASVQPSAPHAAEHWQALQHFTYVQDDERDEWTAYTSIDKAFSGDCEDFAFTLQRQIGGEVWYVMVPGYGPHAVLVEGGYVYENLVKTPVTRVEWEARGSVFLVTMDFKKRGVLRS